MKFDVFVSFRGIDTRRTFVSHLYLLLFNSWITTYKHKEEILENQPPSPQVFQAIEDSKIAIVVISKNYVSSSWCLEELIKIIECKEKGTLEVVPVFYEIDPSDVLRHVDDLRDHDNGDNNLEKVKRWRGALEKLIEIYQQKYSSWEDADSDSDIIDQVLIQVSHCLIEPEIYILQADDGCEEEPIPESHKPLDYDLPTYEVPNMFSLSLQWLRAIVATAPRIAGRFMSKEESSCVKPRPLRKLFDLDEDNDHAVVNNHGPRLKGFDCEPDILTPQGDNGCEEAPIYGSHGPPDYSLAPYEVSNTFCLSLQWLSAIVATALRIARRFMCGEESSCVKLRPLRNFLNVQKDNDYVIGNNLSRLVLSNDFNSFVGMNRLMKEVFTLLDLEAKDATIKVGIFGKRGVGKTTLARCVYEQISPQFQDHHYFINDTTNCSQGTCLLEDIAKASLTNESESLDEVVKAKLGHRKVLLIVDFLDTCTSLNNIIKISHWFGPGSRLIFVTDSECDLVTLKVERRYGVESLRYDEALHLFSLFAFKQEQIPRDYYQLSVRAVTIAGCIPLAIKVFGNFLYGKHISEWEHELCRFEVSRSTQDCVGKVSGYIRDALS